MKRLLAVLTIVALSSLAWSSDAQAGFVIDDFSSVNIPDPTSDSTIDAVPATSSGSAAGSGLTDTDRDFYAVKLSGTLGLDVEMNTLGGLMRFDQEGSGGDAMGYGLIVYDGAAAGPAFMDPFAPSLTGAATDFLQGGANNAIVLNSVMAAGANLDLFIRLFDGTNEAIVGYKDMGTGPLGDLPFLYADFLLNNPLLNLSSIVAVVIGIDGRAMTALGAGNEASGSDLTFDQIAAAGVPEPATFAIWSALCLGLTFIRRRR